MLTLNNAKANTSVKIKKIIGDRPVKRRLMELGFIPGTEILVKRYAPLGDPIELTVMNTQITLRLNDAMNVIIEEN